MNGSGFYLGALRQLAPGLPFIPVVQGWTLGDYLLRTSGREAQAYERSRAAQGPGRPGGRSGDTPPPQFMPHGTDRWRPQHERVAGQLDVADLLGADPSGDGADRHRRDQLVADQPVAAGVTKVRGRLIGSELDRLVEREVGAQPAVGREDRQAGPVLAQRVRYRAILVANRPGFQPPRSHDIVGHAGRLMLSRDADKPARTVVRSTYLACIDRYSAAGVDPAAVPLVGLGSVCRRQATGEIGTITAELARRGLRLHGFGVKQQGLARYADHLESADSLAWSYAARHRPALPGCTRHRNCANCPHYALAWRAQVIADLDGPRQLRLGGVA
jgi:hypothetical protein